MNNCPAFRFGDTKNSRALICDHLKRLSKEERQLRFFSSVSDDFIERYVESSTKDDSFWIVTNSPDMTQVIAALHVAFDKSGESAEFGFSVEKEYTGNGIGTKLVDVAVLVLKSTKTKRVVLNCLSENKAVQAICNKLGFDVSSVSYSEKEGTIDIYRSMGLDEYFKLGDAYHKSMVMPSFMLGARFVERVLHKIFGAPNR